MKKKLNTKFKGLRYRSENDPKKREQYLLNNFPVRFEIDKQPEDMYDPDVNIEAATVLLKRIADRIDKPDAAKVGSIWNYTGREKTNEFGEYIGKVYQEKPWAKY